MKYFKKNYLIDTMYMKVEKTNGDFYEGPSLHFNKNEDQLKGINIGNWLDFKSCKHLITEITKEEFESAFKKALSMFQKII